MHTIVVRVGQVKKDGFTHSNSFTHSDLGVCQIRSYYAR